MSEYTPYTLQSWPEGSAITQEKLEKMEQGIFGAFRNRGILDNNSDLNRVLQTGFYFLPGTEATPSYNYENLPEEISKKNYKLFEVFLLTRNTIIQRLMDPKLGDIYIRQIIRIPDNSTYVYHSWRNKLLDFEELKELNLRSIDLSDPTVYKSTFNDPKLENTYGRTVLSSGWINPPNTSYLSPTTGWVITLGKNLSGSGYGLQIVIFEDSNVIQMRRKLSSGWQQSWMSLGGFPNQRLLPSGSDLNSVTESGYYLLDVAAEYVNLPTMDSDLSSRYKILEVFRHTSAGSVTQRLTIPSKNITYTRVKIGSTNFSNVWHCSNEELKEETDELKKYNTYNIINDYPKTSETRKNVTYTWNNDICTMDGANSEDTMSRNIIYYNRSGFPTGIGPRSKLEIKFLQGAYNNAYVNFVWYTDLTDSTKVAYSQGFNSDGETIIPANCVGMKIDLGVLGGESVSNLKVQVVITSVPDNIYSLQNQLDNLINNSLHDIMEDIDIKPENIVYQNKSDPNDGSKPKADRWIQCTPYGNRFKIKGRNTTKFMTRVAFFGAFGDLSTTPSFPPNVGPGTQLKLHFIKGKNTEARFAFYQYVKNKGLSTSYYEQYQNDAIIKIKDDAIGIVLGFGILGKDGAGGGVEHEIQNEIDVQISLSVYNEEDSFTDVAKNMKLLAASTPALISQSPDSFKPRFNDQSSFYIDLNSSDGQSLKSKAKPAIFLSEDKQFAFVTYGENIVESRDDYPRVSTSGTLQIVGQTINIGNKNITGTPIVIAKKDNAYTYNKWDGTTGMTFEGGCGLPSGAHGYQFFSSAFTNTGRKYNSIDNYGMRPCCRKITISNTTGTVNMGPIEELSLTINGEKGEFDVHRIDENNVNLSLYYTTAAPFYEESTTTWHWLIPVKNGFAYCTCKNPVPKNWNLERVFETPYQPICEISCAIFSDAASPTSQLIEDNKRLVFAIRDQKTGIYVGFLSANKTSIERTYLIPSVSAKATLVKAGNSGLLLLNETNKKECSYIEIELRIYTQHSSRLTFTEWFKLFGRGTWYATIEQESIKGIISAGETYLYIAGGNGDTTQLFNNETNNGRLTFFKLYTPYGVVSAQKFNQNFEIK